MPSGLRVFLIEVLALYFRDINRKFCLGNNGFLFLSQGTPTLSVSSTLQWYSRLDAEIADQFYTMSLGTGALSCKMPRHKLEECLCPTLRYRYTSLALTLGRHLDYPDKSECCDQRQHRTQSCHLPYWSSELPTSCNCREGNETSAREA